MDQRSVCSGCPNTTDRISVPEQLTAQSTRILILFLHALDFPPESDLSIRVTSLQSGDWSRDTNQETGRATMASHIATVFLLSAIFVCVQSCTPVFKDCGSEEGKVSSVSINGTCETEKAILKKKTYVAITIQFQSNEVTPTLSTVVHGEIGPVPVPFPVQNPDACKDSGVSCPLQSGKTYTYTSVIYVNPTYPSISVIVKWELQDSNKKDVVCIVIPAEITS